VRLGVEVGQYVHFAADYHIYARDLERAKQLLKTPSPPPIGKWARLRARAWSVRREAFIIHAASRFGGGWRMPALSLLYIVGKLAKRGGRLEKAGASAEDEVSVALEELFDELHALWTEKGIALCSDLHQVLDQLDLLEKAGYLKKDNDESKGIILKIKIETLKKFDEIIPAYIKEYIPII